MLRMTPLDVEGKPLGVAARLAELTGFVAAAAREGLPAHELERRLWHHLLRLGHDLQAAYFALAGDGDCGETLTLADGRVVQRLPDPHGRPSVQPGIPQLRLAQLRRRPTHHRRLRYPLLRPRLYQLHQMGVVAPSIKPLKQRCVQSTAFSTPRPSSYLRPRMNWAEA